MRPAPANQSFPVTMQGRNPSPASQMHQTIRRTLRRSNLPLYSCLVRSCLSHPLFQAYSIVFHPTLRGETLQISGETAERLKIVGGL